MTVKYFGLLPKRKKKISCCPRATHYLECIKDNERRRSIYAERPTVGIVFRFQGGLGGAFRLR